MQRFLYDIFNRIEGDRFALEFRGRTRRVETLDRAARKEKDKKVVQQEKKRERVEIEKIEENRSEAEVRNSTEVLSFWNERTRLRSADLRTA